MRKYLIPVLIIAIAATGCKKDKNTDTGKYFSGGITVKAPSYLLVSQSVDISLIITITKPESNIQYEFSLPSFSPETVTNTNGVITGITAPSVPGRYTITATATHPDYNNLSALAAYVVVLDPSSPDSYSGYINGSSFMTDSRDNKRYYHTQIGSLDWMTSNLQWTGAGQSIDSTSALDPVYGRLYTWQEATGGVSGSGIGGGPRGVCPTGWSIPTNDDWANFASTLAGSSLPFENIWEGLGNIASAPVMINDTRLWTIYSPDNMHINSAKWNGVPAGSFSILNPNPGTADDIYTFQNKGKSGLWWSATQSNADMAFYRHIDDQNANFPYERGNKKYLGASVRCVRIH